MPPTTLVEALVRTQTETYNVHTDTIVEFAQRRDGNYDEVIKKLVDERRKIYNEFAKRIERIQATTN